MGIKNDAFFVWPHQIFHILINSFAPLRLMLPTPGNTRWYWTGRLFLRLFLFAIHAAGGLFPAGNWNRSQDWWLPLASASFMSWVQKKVAAPKIEGDSWTSPYGWTSPRRQIWFGADAFVFSVTKAPNKFGKMVPQSISVTRVCFSSCPCQTSSRPLSLLMPSVEVKFLRSLG